MAGFSLTECSAAGTGRADDSLCACKILTAILKSCDIPFSLRTVAGYGDLLNLHRDLIADSMDLWGIVLVNCGAMLDLSETSPYRLKLRATSLTAIDPSTFRIYIAVLSLSFSAITCLKLTRSLQKKVL